MLFNLKDGIAKVAHENYLQKRGRTARIFSNCSSRIYRTNDSETGLSSLLKYDSMKLPNLHTHETFLVLHSSEKHFKVSNIGCDPRA